MDHDREKAANDLPIISIHRSKRFAWPLKIGGCFLLMLAVVGVTTRWQEKDTPWIAGGLVALGLTLLLVGRSISKDDRPTIILYADGFEIPGMQEGRFFWVDIQEVVILSVQASGLTHWLGVTFTEGAKTKCQLSWDAKAAMTFLTRSSSSSVDFAFPAEMMEHHAYMIADEMKARMSGIAGPITKQRTVSNR